jgi:hypothetical protein
MNDLTVASQKKKKKKKIYQCVLPGHNELGHTVKKETESDFSAIQSQSGLSCNLFTVIYSYTPWPESARELYPQRDGRLSVKLVPTFADRGCHVVNMTDHYGRILRFPEKRPLRFISSSFSIVLTRLSGPHS